MGTSSNKTVLVGLISSPHGVRGQVKIKTFLQNPLDINTYGPIIDEKGTPFLDILPVRLQGSFLIASLKSITDRDQALLLKGKKLFVYRTNMPAPEEDTFYETDLIGLEVHTSTKKHIGVVLSISDFGAGPLLEIKNEETLKNILVLFKSEVVPIVDLKNKYLIVEEDYLKSIET